MRLTDSVQTSLPSNNGYLTYRLVTNTNFLASFQPIQHCINVERASAAHYNHTPSPNRASCEQSSAAHQIHNPQAQAPLYPNSGSYFVHSLPSSHLKGMHKVWLALGVILRILVLRAALADKWTYVLGIHLVCSPLMRVKLS